MNERTIELERSAVERLVNAASADGALLYLYLHSGGDPARAEQALHFTAARYSCAQAALRQLGLLARQEPQPLIPGERPAYTEEDVLDAMRADQSFHLLYGEFQRILCRTLNTEELKILLGFTRYLGLSTEVLSLLLQYCISRARRQGRLRNPSLRTIEKEAHAWAEQGIDTVELAAAFIEEQNRRHSRMGQILSIVQVRDRSLTRAEENYVNQWISQGFDNEAISMAYEKTCLNTGGLKWPYMNGILRRWHEAGLHTAAQIRAGDRRKDNPGDRRAPNDDERAAIARMLQGD